MILSRRPLLALTLPTLAMAAQAIGPQLRGSRVAAENRQHARAFSTCVRASPSTGDVPAADVLITTRRHLAAMALLAGCPCCSAVASEGRLKYGTAGRPVDWGGYCDNGTRQSPIDLRSQWFASGTAERCSSLALDIRYPSSCKASIKSTGSGTMQVNLQGGGTLLLRGVPYTLLQYHFHTPSEHALDGERAAMEAHLVHANEAGDLAVLGVLLQPTGSDPQPALAAALQHAPPGVGNIVPCPVPVSPSSLLPAAQPALLEAGAAAPGDMGSRLGPYVHYSGSLTTPPCSEGVDWMVLQRTLPVTPQQVAAFRAYVGRTQVAGTNARPLQPLNGRAARVNCLDL